MLDRSKTFLLKDGRKLGYIEYGDPHGRPLFFFHGFPGSRFSGRETHEDAQKIGVRVISTDRPGMGFSDFKKDRKLLEWPGDVVQLGDHLGIHKFSVLGVSGGGPYAAACAYKIPDRLVATGIVVGLAPVSVKSNLEGIPFLNRFGWRNYHRSLLLRTVSAFGAAVWFKYLPWSGMLMAFRNKEDRALFKKIMKTQQELGEERSGKEAFRHGLRGPADELRLFSDDWDFDLKDIRSPVYLWYGVKDRSVSLKMGEYYRSQIPGSQLFIDPDGGHLARYHFEEKILRKVVFGSKALA